MSETLINSNQILGGTGSKIKVLNVIQTGTLTRDGAVFSGFSQSNYLQLGARVDKGILSLDSSTYSKNIASLSTANSWEIMVKFTTPATINLSTEYPIYGQISGNYTTPQIEIYNSKINWCYSINGSTWEYDETEDFTFATSTTYYISYKFTGTKIILQIYDENKEVLFTKEVDETNHVYSTGNLALGKDGNNSFGNGIIDLEECYIKINGEYWWKGVEQI